MKWPLKKTYVAEKLLQSIGECIAARRFLVTGEDDDRKIRPGRLSPDPIRQACEIRRCNGLFDNHCSGGAIAKFETQVGKVGADQWCPSRLLQELGGDLGIAAMWSENQNTL